MTKLTNLETPGIQFIEFWLAIASELGTSRLRLNPEARNINELFDRNSDAQLYLQTIIKRSYKANRCQHLRSSISLASILDLLGETAYQLKGEQADDLMDIELLEEIAWLSCNRYTLQLQQLISEQPADEPDHKTGKIKSVRSRVVSFPNYKIRKANSQI